MIFSHLGQSTERKAQIGKVREETKEAVEILAKNDLDVLDTDELSNRRAKKTNWKLAFARQYEVADQTFPTTIKCES